jgi:putative tricarboxylic transport membrane protein
MYLKAITKLTKRKTIVNNNNSSLRGLHHSWIQPRPFLISKPPDLFWGAIASMNIGNGMLLILNLPLIGIWIRILKVPYHFLFPLISLFCFLGVYSLDNNIYEVLIMVIFGVLGYLMRKFGFEGAPFLLALVLGPMLEVNSWSP